jgi:hypothetical protein
MASRTWVRTLAAAAAAASIVFGGIQGFATSLGTGTGGPGATSRIVAACGSGLTLGYTTTFDRGISAYAVDRIELSNIPVGCLDKSLTATFYGGDANATGYAVSATFSTAGTTQTIPIDPNWNTIDAGQVSGVSVVVS